MIMCAEYVSIYLFISLSLIYLHIFTRIENKLLFEVSVGETFLRSERLL